MGYDSKHFSLSLPKGDEQNNIAKLLRHLALEIENLGNVEILDIVFHSEIIDGKDWPNFTVYFIDS